MANLYLYFSGTGNTRFIVKKFIEKYETKEYLFHSVEDDIDFDKTIKSADMIMVAHPIYGSDIPEIMSEFLKEHSSAFKNKRLMTLVTQAQFSGDGAMLAYRILKKQNVKLVASMHFNMPYNATDFKLEPIKTLEESKQKIDKAVNKIDKYVLRLKNGMKVRTGRGFFSWFMGFFTQRLYFGMFRNKMKKMVKVNSETCIDCKKCINSCPMHNLEMVDDKIIGLNNCTLCYRCVNICPTQSIRIFGRKKPQKQFFNNK